MICTRDRPQYLDRCLSSVRALDFDDYEVIVVDNASATDAAYPVAERHNARYVNEPVAGHNRARNTGAMSATGDVVAFTDDDITVDPGWLQALVHEFDSPDVMAVTGRIETPEGAVPLGSFVREWFTIDRNTTDWFSMANFGGAGNGGNMAFRRELFETGFRFDTRLGLGSIVQANDEHFAFFQVVDRGHRLVHTPHAVVRHLVSEDWDASARASKALTGLVGYLMLLFFEQSRHRRDLFRHLWRAIRRRRPPWRASTGPSSHSLATVTIPAAIWGGIRQYLRARRHRF